MIVGCCPVSSQYAIWPRSASRTRSGNLASVPAPYASRLVVEGVVIGHPTSELYLVSRDGQVKQLTHLNAYNEDGRLVNNSWSPDGRYIAAWLDTPSLRKEQEAELVIVDTETQ